MTPDPCGAWWATTSKPCTEPATKRLGDVRLCDHHYHRTCEAAIAVALRQQDELDNYWYGSREWEASADEVVYYVQRLSDGLVKIGTSTRPRSRLSELRKDHGTVHLLMTYRGGYREEAEVHRKFEELRVEGEFFRPRKPLLEWIIRIRQRQPERTLLPGTLPMDDLMALARRRGRPREIRLAGTLAGMRLDRLRPYPL